MSLEKVVQNTCTFLKNVRHLMSTITSVTLLKSCAPGSAKNGYYPWISIIHTLYLDGLVLPHTDASLPFVSLWNPPPWNKNTLWWIWTRIYWNTIISSVFPSHFTLILLFHTLYAFMERTMLFYLLLFRVQSDVVPLEWNGRRNSMGSRRIVTWDYLHVISCVSSNGLPRPVSQVCDILLSSTNHHQDQAHVLCLEVILKKKTFFKLTVRTHDLRHMTMAMLATSRHNHLTICPLTTSKISLNIACHCSASRQHKMIFPSKWYLHPN